MDIHHEPLRVALTIKKGKEVTPVKAEPGAPIVPVIGGTPNKETQDKPLLEIIADLNKIELPTPSSHETKNFTELPSS